MKCGDVHQWWSRVYSIPEDHNMSSLQQQQQNLPQCPLWLRLKSNHIHTNTLGGEHYPTFSCHVVVFSNSFSITLKLIFQWISYFITMILWKYYVQCTLLKIPKKWVNYELWQSDKIIWFWEVSLSDVFYFNFVHLNINFEYIYINFRYIYLYIYMLRVRVSDKMGNLM